MENEDKNLKVSKEFDRELESGLDTTVPASMKLDGGLGVSIMDDESFDAENGFLIGK